MSSHRQPTVSDRVVQQVAAQAELNTSYLVFMAMSGILAAVALLTNSVPILIRVL